MKLVEESSSSSKAEDEISAIAVDPINIADTATTPTAPPAPYVARPAERRIIIMEPTPKEPTPKEVLEGKGKKKVKRASTVAFRDSTPSPIRRAKREVEEKKLREED